MTPAIGSVKSNRTAEQREAVLEGVENLRLIAVRIVRLLLGVEEVTANDQVDQVAQAIIPSSEL